VKRRHGVTIKRTNLSTMRGGRLRNTTNIACRLQGSVLGGDFDNGMFATATSSS
jgi:hypothetical protein